MSRYRWLRPLKCIETMETFEGTKDNTFEENEKLLFARVSNGDIRSMLNDEIVLNAHIAVFLQTYAKANPDQNAFVLPPDLRISYDDLRKVFDRPVIDSRKPGRPRKENVGWSEDRMLAAEMHRMLAGHPSYPRAKSAADAARILVEQNRVSGAGTDESLVKRLVRTFRKYHTS